MIVDQPVAPKENGLSLLDQLGTVIHYINNKLFK